MTEPLIEEQPDGAVNPLDPKARRLRALAGANTAYIFLTFGPDDMVNADFAGLYPEDVPSALRQIAEMFEAE